MKLIKIKTMVSIIYLKAFKPDIGKFKYHFQFNVRILKPAAQIKPTSAERNIFRISF